MRKLVCFVFVCTALVCGGCSVLDFVDQEAVRRWICNRAPQLCETIQTDIGE